jgi:ribonuclease P/MRP protein subunit POP5
MKPLLPSLKERKRYIVFEVIARSSMKERDVSDAITQSLHEYIGDLGMAQAGLQFIKWKNNKGIARVNHTSADLLKASFTFIRSIKNKKAIVRSLGTSGILIKAQKNYMAG